MKKVKLLSTSVTVLFLLTICTSCGKNATSESVEAKSTDVSAVTQTTDLTSTTETPQTSFPYFSKDQVLDDYNTMLDILDKNYPNFITARNLYGANKDEIYAKYKNKIENLPDELKIDEALKIYNDFIVEFGQIGHFSVIGPAFYQDELEKVSQYKDSDNLASETYKILTNESAVRTIKYIKDTNFSYRPPFFPERLENTIYPETPTNISNLTEINENLSYKVIDDSTVYLNINSFDPLDIDKPLLLNFYKQMNGYKNLVIDITKNGGGSDYYWMYNIVQPNITKDISIPTYSLAKSAGIYQNLANDTSCNRSSIIYETVSNLPDISNEALAEFDIAFETDYTVKSIGSTKSFDGNIYILVGSNVYSASEGFAKISKDSGFATLVGSNTGGDGGSFLNIQFFLLPNTGLLFRFSTLFPLNSDDSSNTEFGTKPDFYARENQSALDRCLEIIGN